MFEAALNIFKDSLVVKNGRIKKKKGPELPTGNRMWEIAARSNARPKIVKLNGKIINGEQKMSELYNVVKDGKVIKTGTQDECEYFATWNAQHGEVVPAD